MPTPEHPLIEQAEQCVQDGAGPEEDNEDLSKDRDDVDSDEEPVSADAFEDV